MKNLREINSRMAEMLAAGINDENREQYAALEREFAQAKRDNDIELQESQSREMQPKKEFSMTKMLREIMHGKDRQVELRTALTAAGLAGKAVETEIQNILEPLHENSALTKLGVKWYTGMPMGDISIPVMNAGDVTWAGETGDNADGTPTFGNNIVLKPYRLTGFFDCSEQMLLKDTVGVEAALRREAVNALAAKYEATVLGNGSGLAADGETRISPAGLFYNQDLASAKTFAQVCELESNVEDALISGPCKYLIGTKAKADLRAMATNGNGSPRVLTAGNIDGTEVVMTQHVKKTTGTAPNIHVEGPVCYGDFSNLACASWNNLIFKVDDSVAYANGKIRIYVTGYFDAKVLRSGAFAFGNTRYVSQG